MERDSIDTYLAGCVRACMHRTAMPPWPTQGSGAPPDAVIQRVKFHGIALLLAQQQPAFPDWPAEIAEGLKDEARMQALWEASHRRAITRLIEGFAAAGITTAAMKGTALAYGFHADPATRRRGDTDLYLPGASRTLARRILRQCGFDRSGDIALTQEPWAYPAPDGFIHEADIHWRINSSATVSRALERLGCEQRFVSLPRLSPNAVALSPLDNLILTCVNRGSHQNFGYHVEDSRLADGNRLVWAVDIHLITARFTPADWDRLGVLAPASGTSGLVGSALAFAAQSIGLTMPDGFLDRLAAAPGDDAVTRYLGEHSAARRFRMEIAAARSPWELARLLQLWLFPGRVIMAARFPDAEGWPLWALHMRRLALGGRR